MHCYPLIVEPCHVLKQASFYGVALWLACSVATVSPTSAQNLSQRRSWTDVSGRHSVDAQMVDFNEIAVKLHTGKRAVVMQRNKLSKADREYLEACDILRQSADQASSIVSQLETDNLRNASLMAALEAIGKSSPSGLVSDFYLGGLKPVQTRKEVEIKEAIRINQRVISAIKKVQQHFPGVHTKTLASVYNNQAVVAARNGSAEGFANFLKLSGEATPGTLSFATHHNASLLLSSKIDLGGARRTLQTVVGLGDPEPGPRVQSRLHYTFAHDPFHFQMESSNTSSSDGSDSDSMETTGNTAPVSLDELTLVSSGSAFLLTPQYAMTNRHVVKDVEVFLLTNDHGLEVKATVLAVSSDVHIDLAILKLDQSIDVPPLHIRKSNPRQEEEIVALGYPLPGRYEPSLMSNRGSISKFMIDGKNMLHTATVEPGNSGGPCVDLSGRVAGVNYATDRQNEVRNYAVLPEDAARFAEDSGVELPSPILATHATFADTIEACREAVLMVHCYAIARPSPPSAPSTGGSSGGDRSATQHSLLADDCCLWCGGRTYVTCPSCINGKTSIRRVVIVGRSVDGSPISAPKTFKQDCPRCNLGKVSCPACGGTGNSH
ncbi:trypsin-like peptidase domain-containing protein [Aporhodopirellula aestuarii]|uniref:Trypsin-like peptidase domain-containing protein n=1 Tax=Aporhodopirellula aestuarii TaxID=2950107 RepID=A0ABT0U4N8_9BACT|nr:trypsin-like peptidase domain-containing protein [Aporhodopirellula aestuarii]MCM2371862.1 trypsin-like peptidase domain-containing protein [Aporhodopirellula aestuarii]